MRSVDTGFITLRQDYDIDQAMQDIRQALIHSGCLDPELPPDSKSMPSSTVCSRPGIEAALRAVREGQDTLRQVVAFLDEHVITPIFYLEPRIREPEHFDELRDLLAKLLRRTEDLRRQRDHVRELVIFRARLLALYILILHRCGSAGRPNPIIEMMLANIAQRKAVELDRDQFSDSMRRLEETTTIALIAKRHGVYVLAAHGLSVIFNSEIDFRTYGKSPEELALRITNLLVKNGIKLAEVTDLVCGGGDLGPLPDGIYTLTEKVRDESWKRLPKASLNRGALIAWELKKLLALQNPQNRVNASLCSPLSFTTITAHDVDSLCKERTFGLIDGMKGFVKVMPLKATSALVSEIENVNTENLNLVVMVLDDLFASVVRKTGPHIIRELAAQDANQALSKFDFARIAECLGEENFTIPPHFRLAARDIGTGVGEICELLMIAESGKVSPSLSRSLMHVVDAYARHVAMVLQMACAGEPPERPHYIIVTSMRAIDPNFRQLFGKIRDRIDIPFTPVLCLYSFEHEYLIANHLFELYANRAGGDKRLDLTVEASSMKQAVKVLESSAARESVFSFASLLDEVTESISEGKLKPANVVVVGADNEDALMAVSQAKELGLMDRIALIGDPEETEIAVAHSKVALSPGSDPSVEMIPIDPLAADSVGRKKSTAEIFRRFIEAHPDFIIMKGSLDSDAVLRQALSIYSPGSGTREPDKAGSKKVASHTALFVLPNGRFFALSDAGVNPGFKSADVLLKVVENQIDVLRKVVDPGRALKLAIITAVEKETSAIPTTVLAAETAARSQELQEKYGPLVVEGPLSFDLATAPEVAEEKNYHGRIQGDADCLVATELNTANVLYKMLTKTVGSLGLIVDNGGIITAGPGTAPIVLTSRGDTAQTKLNSILLALCYSLRVRETR